MRGRTRTIFITSCTSLGRAETERVKKGTPMNITIFRAAVGAIAALVTASAGAAPVVIDTQQKAAAAALTAHNSSSATTCP